jgi:hypothetical protein
MGGKPGPGEWIALAGLWAAVAAGFAVGLRARGRGLAPPTASELPPDRSQELFLVLACLPAVAAVLTGAPWLAILWWAAFALPASIAAASLVSPVVLALRGRRAPAPDGPVGAGPLVEAVALGSAVAVGGGLLLAGAEPRLAAAATLLAGYGLWRAAYAARARTGPAP